MNIIIAQSNLAAQDARGDAALRQKRFSKASRLTEHFTTHRELPC